jgi:hypothetical protein
MLLAVLGGGLAEALAEERVQVLDAADAGADALDRGICT